MSFLHIPPVLIDEVGVNVRPGAAGDQVLVRFGEPGSGAPRLVLSIAEAENLRDQLNAAIAEAVES